MTGKYFLLPALALVGLAGCSRAPASPAKPKQTAVAAGEIGSQLPDFALKDLQGHEVSSADLRGKVVLIDFWATWCQPCKKEMPGYQKLLDRYGSRGLAAVGFKFDTMRDTENPLKFAKRIGVRYSLAVASEGLKQDFGGIEGLPTTMLYDRKGILRDKVIGFEYTEHFEQELKPLLEAGQGHSGARVEPDQ
jgi:thiol-disulfide isomerase/thioredoxin